MKEIPWDDEALLELASELSFPPMPEKFITNVYQEAACIAQQLLAEMRGWA